MDYVVSGAAEADVELLERLYAALRAGDRDGLAACLDPAFVGVVAEGMPAGAGRHEGADAAIDAGWWAIGAAFAVTAQREEYVGCADGRVLVRGRYVGRSRDGAHAVDAAFTHLWTLRDGRALAIEQVTDTARWSMRGQTLQVRGPWNGRFHGGHRPEGPDASGSWTSPATAPRARPA